jgi:hypothetical protein
MPVCEIHVKCDFCRGEHRLLIKVHLDYGPDCKQSLAESFHEGAVPPQLLAIRDHKALCLKTGKKFKIENDEQVLLVPASFY